MAIAKRDGKAIRQRRQLCSLGIGPREQIGMLEGWAEPMALGKATGAITYRTAPHFATTGQSGQSHPSDHRFDVVRSLELEE